MSDVDTAPESVTEFVHEDLFPPKPGGMVDTARKQKAAEQAQIDELPEPAEDLFQHAVPVLDQAAELARARTFSVATGNGNPIVELLGRDDNRRNAIIMTLDQPVVISFSQTAADDPRNTSAGSSDVLAPASSAGEGSVTNPGAAATIATTASVAAGTYVVTATVFLSGTVAAGDLNNFQITGNGVTSVKIVVPAVANTVVTMTATVTTTSAGAIIVKSIGAASGVSAVYNASVVATPASTDTSGTTGTSANGFVLPVNVPLPVNYKGVIYCTAISATASRVSVAAFTNPER